MSNNEYISGEENKGIFEQSINSEKFIHFIISVPQEKNKNFSKIKFKSEVSAQAIYIRKIE